MEQENQAFRRMQASAQIESERQEQKRTEKRHSREQAAYSRIGSSPEIIQRTISRILEDVDAVPDIDLSLVKQWMSSIKLFGEYSPWGTPGHISKYHTGVKLLDSLDIPADIHNFLHNLKSVISVEIEFRSQPSIRDAVRICGESEHVRALSRRLFKIGNLSNSEIETLSELFATHNFESGTGYINEYRRVGYGLDPSARLCLANYLFTARRSQDAITEYAKVIQADAASDRQRGFAYVMLAETTDSVDPFSVGPYFDIDEPYIDNGEALRHLNTGDARMPTIDGIHTGPLSRKPEARTYLKEAESAFVRHLASEPNDDHVLWMLVSIYSTFRSKKKEGEIRARIRLGTAPPHASSATTTTEEGRIPGIGKSLSWQEFERQCLRLMESMGFKATLTEPGPDGGIDIVAENTLPLLSGTYLIQCKKWSGPVGEPVLRDLYGLVISQGAVKGIVITTAEFTEAARKFASLVAAGVGEGDAARLGERRFQQGHAVRRGVTV